MSAHKSFLLIFLIFVSSLICGAQSFIALDVYGLIGFKRIKIYSGDVMTFKLKNDTKLYKKEIIALWDTTFEIENQTISLNQIRMVYIDKSNFVINGCSAFLIIGGAAFLGLTLVNGVINNYPADEYERGFLAAGSAVIIGELIKSLGRRRYHINKNRTLKIIDARF
jgi:hypothetical protein